jgi:hypothetical protein
VNAERHWKLLGLHWAYATFASALAASACAGSVILLAGFVLESGSMIFRPADWLVFPLFLIWMLLAGAVGGMLFGLPVALPVAALGIALMGWIERSHRKLRKWPWWLAVNLFVLSFAALASFAAGLDSQFVLFGAAIGWLPGSLVGMYCWHAPFRDSAVFDEAFWEVTSSAP